jgi:hypothetical protein
MTLVVVGFIVVVAVAIWVAGQATRDTVASAATETTSGGGSGAPALNEPATPRGAPPRLPAAPADFANLREAAATAATLLNLSSFVEAYRADEGTLPASLADLVQTYALEPDALLDQWQHEVRYETLGLDSYRLTSAGADGAFDTADDVEVEDHELQSLPGITPEMLREVQRRIGELKPGRS